MIEETNEDVEPKVQEYVAPVEGVGEARGRSRYIKSTRHFRKGNCTCGNNKIRVIWMKEKIRAATV